jgi:hypothetical protein
MLLFRLRLLTPADRGGDFRTFARPPMCVRADVAGILIAIARFEATLAFPR